jgi:hypothetical protein
VFCLHFIELYDHIFQREQTPLDQNAGILQLFIISLQIPIGNHYGLGYMRTQIVRAASRIAFSEHVFLSIDAAFKATKKNEGLKFIIAMGEVNRQNFKSRIADNFTTLLFQ